eukprot:CAMPEP_0172471516 /NCGR_PEP_ID=MMETSP1065-20121228/67859_1 /TAXON_ID=265537 /ORGANISM="Amphiprora paludosa, Strain CCMP125" /LENGTH=417 /DNA_ID=CAMNT_0013229619 /DNA_START=27 /DNA_END=1280 /DNA_ORIENTATION=+
MGDTYGETIKSYGSPLTTRFECENVYALNGDDLASRTLGYAYELLFNCEDDVNDQEAEAIAFIESQMLAMAQQKYLTFPDKCVVPQDYWFAAIDSTPEDFATNVKCTSFTEIPENSCCTVVQGNMTFTELSQVPDIDVMAQWTERQFQDGEDAVAWGDAEFYTKYLGVDSGYTIVTGEDTIDAVIADTPITKPPQDSGFSWMGILMMCFLVLSIILVVFFVVHRRRKNRRSKEYGLAVNKSVDQDGDLGMLEDIDETPSSDWIEQRSIPYGETRVVPKPADIHVVGDEEEDYNENIEIASLASHPFQDTSSMADPNYSVIVSPDCDTSGSSQRNSGAYRFDWQNESQDKEVMGGRNSQVLSYPPRPPQSSSAPTKVAGFAVVPADGTEVEFSTDGSEIDSWAQSQGHSIGSLEQQEY